MLGKNVFLQGDGIVFRLEDILIVDKERIKYRMGRKIKRFSLFVLSCIKGRHFEKKKVLLLLF